MTTNDETPDKGTPEDTAQPKSDAAPEAEASTAAPSNGETAPSAEPSAAPADGDIDEKKDEPPTEEQVADLKDKLLRALAENANILRRTKREREDTSKYAVANFARDMLMATDNLRRALDALPGEGDEAGGGGDGAMAALIDGVKLTERGLLATFERHGIRKIDPMGKKFDHDFHEAMFEVPTADAEPGTVVQVVEVGYVIHGRLLRAARVGIAKAPPENGEQHTLDTKV